MVGGKWPCRGVVEIVLHVRERTLGLAPKAVNVADVSKDAVCLGLEDVEELRAYMAHQVDEREVVLGNAELGRQILRLTPVSTRPHQANGRNREGKAATIPLQLISNANASSGPAYTDGCKIAPSDTAIASGFTEMSV